MIHSRQRQYFNVLAELGVETQVIRQTRHVIARGYYRGHIIPITFSKSPSDRRSLLNFRAHMRRAVAQIDAKLAG